MRGACWRRRFASGSNGETGVSCAQRVRDCGAQRSIRMQPRAAGLSTIAKTAPRRDTRDAPPRLPVQRAASHGTRARWQPRSATRCAAPLRAVQKGPAWPSTRSRAARPSACARLRLRHTLKHRGPSRPPDVGLSARRPPAKLRAGHLSPRRARLAPPSVLRRVSAAPPPTCSSRTLEPSGLLEPTPTGFDARWSL